MSRRPLAVFFVIWAGLLLVTGIGTTARAIPIGDTLTVIQRPLINIPTILTVGDTLRIDCEASPGTSGWAAELLRGQIQVSMPVPGPIA